MIYLALLSEVNKTSSVSTIDVVDFHFLRIKNGLEVLGKFSKAFKCDE